MTPKPGARRDLTKPRSRRLISLLSCLGRGLQQLVAQRPAITAIQHSVAHSRWAEALPKRSATDLAAAVLDDIEHVFIDGLAVPVLKMQIQGAFDTVGAIVSYTVFVNKAGPTGDRLIRWTRALLQDKVASVHYDQTTTPMAPLRCGLPHSSPISPTLFLLYTFVIYNFGVPVSRSGRYKWNYANISMN